MSCELLDGLNEQQHAAVCVDTTVPVLVLAGAGCGKTAVLTRRLAFLATSFAPAENLLALTFTRRAAEEMALRVARLFQSCHTSQLNIMTFHSLAYRIIGEWYDGWPNYVRLGYSTMPRVVDQRERLQMLVGNTTKLERRLLGFDLETLDARIECFEVHPTRLRMESPVKQDLIRAIARRLRQARQRANVWVFSDILAEALRLLDSEPELSAHYRTRFRAILIDEFQDTNPQQIELLTRLRDPTCHIYAVGDDDQAIYGFRGADSGPILNFAALFPGARILKLEINYRSTKRILSAANRIVRDKPPPYRKVLCGKPDGPVGFPPVVRGFGTHEKMFEWILDMCRRISVQEGIAVDRMAVLFRTNESKRLAERFFLARAGTLETTPQCLTVHGSKGLEFSVVFVCDLQEGVFPSYSQRRVKRKWWEMLFGLPPSELCDCDLSEERRLFYVAVTRAQYRLYLLYTRCYEAHGRKNFCRPSRFLHLI